MFNWFRWTAYGRKNKSNDVPVDRIDSRRDVLGAVISEISRFARNGLTIVNHERLARSSRCSSFRRTVDNLVARVERTSGCRNFACSFHSLSLSLSLFLSERLLGQLRFSRLHFQRHCPLWLKFKDCATRMDQWEYDRVTNWTVINVLYRVYPYPERFAPLR